MKIVVLVKRVPDTASVIKIGGDNTSVETGALKYVLNPYDEHAVEQAVQIKEAGEAEILVVSAGDELNKETMRVALAMGADSGVLISDEGLKGASGRGIAKALAAVCMEHNPDLILAGKQAVDDDGAQVGERVAEILGIPHAAVINSLELADGKAMVSREIEGGALTIETSLPALFTAQKGLNTPRYPKLPNIMKAKKKEIVEKNLEALGLSAADVGACYDVVQLEPPAERSGGRILEGDNNQVVAELVSLLKDEHKVL